MCIQGEYSCLEFSLPINVFLIRCDLGVVDYQHYLFSFIFSEDGGSVYISCCNLKFEILLKLNSSLILLHFYQIIVRQSLGHCQKNHKKRRKKCLLKHRKFDKLQEGSSEEAKKELIH